MEAQLRQELGTSMLRSRGPSAGGCISEALSYLTDSGSVFVKINHKSQVLQYSIMYYIIHINISCYL